MAQRLVSGTLMQKWAECASEMRELATHNQSDVVTERISVP